MASLGFFGTGHCVGMCGPIILAVPARAGGVLPQLFYHAGRVTTYTVIGGLVGLLGGGLAWVGGEAPLSNVAVFQTALSTLAALFLALFAAQRVGLVREPRWMSGAAPTALPGYERISAGASRGRLASMLLWGMMLGTLPCGLSWAAFARALASGSFAQGAVLSLVFGIGTLPGLLLIGTAGARLFARHRKLSDLVSSAIMAGMAVALLTDALGVYL
jgi:sulfite exporter TauE/SafE